MPVQRQYVTETFSGSTPGIQDSVTTVYASDQGLALNSSAPPTDLDFVGGLTQDGTYFVTYEFTGGIVDPQNGGYIREFRLTRSGNGSSVTVETRSMFESNWQLIGSGSGSGVFLAPSMDVANYCNFVAAQPGGVDGMESKVPGNWNVDRSMTGPTGTFGPTSVRTFTLRLLALKNLRAEEPKFDPKSERNFTNIKGDVIALPIGWMPSGGIAARLDVIAFGPTLVAPIFDTLTLFASPGPNGEVAEYSLSWDGTIPGKDEPAEGLFQMQARIIAPTTVGTTKAISKEVFVTAVSCSCDCDIKPTGSRKMSLPLDGMPACSVGPAFNLNLDYCLANSNKPASSMGFGWQGKSTCRIFEPAGQGGAVAYRSESGQYLRWNLQAGNYVAAFANNYVELVKNVSEPVYVITFQDQSKREFNAAGYLTRELDRNGQALMYTVDSGSGDLLSMTDSTGQTIYFDYDGRTDGQPRFIRALDPVSGRTLEMVYDANDRLEFLIQPGDGASETTQMVYNTEGLLETMILPSGLQPVTYLYDSLGRVVVEFYTPTATGFESIKEVFYDQDAKDLAVIYGLDFDASEFAGLNFVASFTSDETATASPPRLSFGCYDLLGNRVRSYQLVEQESPLNQSRFNLTISEFQDSLNPRLLTRMIMPNGFSQTMTYNAQGNLATVTESYSNTTMEYRYTEDVDTPPFNPKWRNLLREVHRPAVTVDGSLVTYPPTRFTYEPTYGNLVEIEDAAGNSLVMQVSSDGLVEQVTDRRGFTTVYNYDTVTRRLMSVTTPGGPSGAPSRTTTFTYDDYLNLATMTAPALPSASFTYDDQNRPKRSTSPMGLYSQSNYLNGLLDSMDMPANQGSGVLRRQIQFVYDLADRVQQVLGQTDFMSGSPVLELRVGYLYDGFSQLKNLVRLMDSALKFTQNDYDFLGRLVRSVDFLNPGRETVVAHADYCTGNIVTSPRGVQRESSFDERCRLRQVQTQDEVHTFDYDELNRLTQVRMSSRYAWNTPREGAAYSTGFYAHTTQFRYDELDRVIEVIYPNGETVAYVYNENGDVTSMTDVHGKVTSYTYYNDGRLHTVSYEGLVFLYAYDASGRLQSLTYPTAPDTLVLQLTWDDDGRLLRMDYERNSAPFQSFVYSYDDSGNRITMAETSPTNVTINWAYSYDWFNRLLSVSKNAQLMESYTYDESDNRKTLTRHLSNEVFTYSYDLADQLESITRSVAGGPPVLVESFTSDADGNILSRTQAGIVTDYSWDTHNRLRQVKVDGNVTARSLYDAEGIRRLSKDENGDPSKFFSSGGMSLADQRPGGPVSFLQGHQLLGIEQGGSAYFYLTDALGSVRVVVDNTAALEGAFAYDVWGIPDASATPPSAELRAHTFQGGLGVRNDGSPVYYARQRYYDASLGRWLSADPIGFDGGLNLYAAMGNNPTTNVDPEGLDWTSGANALKPPVVPPPTAPTGPVRAPLGGLGPAAAIIGIYYFMKEQLKGGRAENPTPAPGPSPQPSPSPKSSDGGDCGECDLVFVRELYRGGDTKTCWYRKSGVMFTFAQWKNKPCPPINLVTCMVDTSYINPPIGK